MNTVWQTTEPHLQLNRYPKGQHDKSLQAWDSADEYLIQHCLPIFQQAEKPVKIAIVNDLFGALSCALADYQPTLITDSYVSQLATLQNAKDNELTAPKISNSLEDWQNADYVLLKLTKNIGYLEHQLQQISQLTAPCKIIAAGKTTSVTSNVIKLFEKYLLDVSTSLAKKKSRLIFANFDPKSANKTTSKYPISIHWQEQNLKISSHANVFSKEQIDIGGRFLAENLPVINNGQTVIDLGCGNGLLGLACLRQLKENQNTAAVKFIDESFMAIASSELNVTNNFPNQKSNCEFLQDDCLTEQPNESADMILCNPPFHQQNTITEHIAKQMFKQAYDRLKFNGQLIVVANRHLPYQGVLKKLFGGFGILAQNNKFVIFQCNKNN